MSADSSPSSKPAYEKPAVIFVEKIETRAVGCLSGDAISCAEGPIQS